MLRNSKQLDHGGILGQSKMLKRCFGPPTPVPPPACRRSMIFGFWITALSDPEVIYSTFKTRHRAEPTRGGRRNRARPTS